MEMLCFGFLIGVVFAIIVFGAGVLYDDRIYKRERNNNNSRGICGNRIDNDTDCVVGNVHGKVNNRRNFRPCDEDDGK